MKGKIIKSIAGFYEVHTGDNIYRCRARGVFRALGVKPLVGDDVEIEITDTVSVPMEGNVIRLLPRRNELVRPNVANVDQALLIFAITHPAPSYNMLDRFLITMNQKNLPSILCFNKQDLATQEEIRELRETYESCGCRVLFVSVLSPDTLEELREILKGKTIRSVRERGWRRESSAGRSREGRILPGMWNCWRAKRRVILWILPVSPRCI